jgi:type III secretory pathway component EscS
MIGHMSEVILAIEFPADWVAPEFAPFLFAGLVLAGLGTISLFVLSVVAYWRRLESRYLLITLALGALATRTIVGWGTVFGLVPMTVHHLLEHTLDFLIALLVIYAVYRSGGGSVQSGRDTDAD